MDRLKGFKLLTTIIFVISLFLLLGCQANDSKKGSNLEWHVFESERFRFSVNYPAEWPAIVQGEDNMETPDAGIMLNVDGDANARIFIFGQLGTLEIPDDPGSRSEALVTKSGLKGNLLIQETEDTINLYYFISESELESFHGRFLGAAINMSKEKYVRYETVIRDILTSIKLLS